MPGRKLSGRKIDRAVEQIRSIVKPKEVKLNSDGIMAVISNTRDEELIVLRRIMKKLFGSKFYFTLVLPKDAESLKLYIAIKELK